MQGIAAVECLHALGERRRFEIKQMRSPVEKLGDFAGRSEHDTGRRDQRRDGNHGALAGGERGGILAAYGVGTDEYERFAGDESLQQLRAMRSSRR